MADSKWWEPRIAKYGSKEAYGKVQSENGRRGGQKGKTGGFYNNPTLAREIGSKGGKATAKRKQALKA